MQFDVLELRVVAVFFAPLANQLARGGFSIRAPFVPAPPTTENILLRFGKTSSFHTDILGHLVFLEILWCTCGLASATTQFVAQPRFSFPVPTRGKLILLCLALVSRVDIPRLKTPLRSDGMELEKNADDVAQSHSAVRKLLHLHFLDNVFNPEMISAWLGVVKEEMQHFLEEFFDALFF